MVLHNVRSAYNVGSLFRTADGLGVKEIYLCGYTPWPAQQGDERLPHLATEINKRIHKTALGAETNVPWQRFESLQECLAKLRHRGFQAVGLEQAAGATLLSSWRPTGKVALIVGPEIGGLTQVELSQLDQVVEIPMQGKKESFNVAVAGAIALYHLTYLDKLA